MYLVRRPPACPPARPPARPLQMGFFSEAGPLQVFVSNHLIPEGFEFNTTHDPCYQTTDGEQKIVAGSEVRLRIVGTRVDANDIVSSDPPTLCTHSNAHALTF